jgi:hypothetical protein
MGNPFCASRILSAGVVRRNFRRAELKELRRAREGARAAINLVAAAKARDPLPRRAFRFESRFGPESAADKWNSPRFSRFGVLYDKTRITTRKCPITPGFVQYARCSDTIG